MTSRTVSKVQRVVEEEAAEPLPDKLAPEVPNIIAEAPAADEEC